MLGVLLRQRDEIKAVRLADVRRGSNFAELSTAIIESRIIGIAACIASQGRIALDRRSIASTDSCPRAGLRSCM